MILKKNLLKDCVAVICVHMGGHPCQMEKIKPWAKKKKIFFNGRQRRKLWRCL